MKKLLLLSLTIVSCKTQSNIEEYDTISVTWKSKIENCDIYKTDTLIVKDVPCYEIKKITLHSYPAGDYKFVFKNNGNVVEEKEIKIMK